MAPKWRIYYAIATFPINVPHAHVRLCRATRLYYLLQRFPYIPHTDTLFSIGSSEHSGIRGIKHDRMEGAFVLCQSFHSVVATYIVNENSPVVAGAGKDFVIVRMNGQPVDRLFVQEDVEGLAPASKQHRLIREAAGVRIPRIDNKRDNLCLTCANRVL